MLCHSEQLAHALLGQPKGLVFEDDFDANVAVGGGVEDDIAALWLLAAHCFLTFALEFAISLLKLRDHIPNRRTPTEQK
jgi:hypothetical protein